MYELIQLTEQTYYIKSPANIGLVRLEGQEVCLIDSGSDKDAGRKVRQILDRNGWTLKAIYNTAICRGRPGAGSTPRASTVPSPGTRSWSRPSSTEATRPRTCGTSF